MDRQGPQLDPSDLKAPAPSRDDIRNPQPPPRQRWSEKWSKVGRGRRWLIGCAVVFGLAAAAGDEQDDVRPAPPPQRVAPLPTDPVVSGYMLAVQDVCRERDRALTAVPTPFDQIVRFEIETTSLIEAVPHPREATGVRRVLLTARRRVDRVTLRAYRAVESSPAPLKTFHGQWEPVIRRTVIDYYKTFAGLGADCDVAY